MSVLECGEARFRLKLSGTSRILMQVIPVPHSLCESSKLVAVQLQICWLGCSTHCLFHCTSDQVPHQHLLGALKRRHQVNSLYLFYILSIFFSNHPFLEYNPWIEILSKSSITLQPKLFTPWPFPPISYAPSPLLPRLKWQVVIRDIRLFCGQRLRFGSHPHFTYHDSQP